LFCGSPSRSSAWRQRARPGRPAAGRTRLCDLLGVSRASVREALRSLETRGLVRVRHGKGVFVAAPDEGERALQRFSRLREVGLEELFAMREVLEVPAAGWAATEASDEQLASLIATFEQHEQAVRTQAGPEQLRVVDAPAPAIAEYDNRFLTMTQHLLQEMLSRAWIPPLGGREAPVGAVGNALVAHDSPGHALPGGTSEAPGAPGRAGWPKNGDGPHHLADPAWRDRVCCPGSQLSE
jgi:Mn-dependent DtxR family transcriptional regulator